MDWDRGRRDRYSSRSPSRSRRRNTRRNDSRERTRNRTGEREKGGGQQGGASSDRRETVWPPAPPQRRDERWRGDSREKERGDRGGAGGGRGNYNNKYVSSSSGGPSDRMWTNQNSSRGRVSVGGDRDWHRTKDARTQGVTRDARSNSREKRKDARSDARNSERSRSRNRSMRRAPEQAQERACQQAPGQQAPPIPVAPLPPGQPPPPPADPGPPPPPPADPGYKTLPDPVYTKSSPQKPPPAQIVGYGQQPPAAMIPAGYENGGTTMAPGIVPLGGIIPGPETMTTPKSKPHQSVMTSRAAVGLLPRSNSLLSRQSDSQLSRTEEEKSLGVRSPQKPPVLEEARPKSAKIERKPLPEFIIEQRMTKLPRVKNPVIIDHTKKKKKNDNQDDKKEEKKAKKKKLLKDMGTKKKKDKVKDKNNDNEESWPSASDVIIESSESEDTASNSSGSSKRDRTPSPVPRFSIKDWLRPTGGTFMKPTDDPFGIKGKTTKYKYKDLNRPPTRKDPPQVQYSAHSMLTESYADLLAQSFCSIGVKAQVIEAEKKPSRAARYVEKSLKSSPGKHRKSDKSSLKPEKGEKKKARGELDFV